MGYKLLSTTAEVQDLLPRLMQRPAWGFDTETTGLNPLVDKVLMLQIGTSHEQYIIDTRKASPEPLRPFFESQEHKKIAHNATFDWKMIKANFGIETECVRDTYLAEKILFNGIKDYGFGLDDVLLSHLNVELNKETRALFGKGAINHDYSEEMLRYAASDVEHLIPLAQTQSSLMAEMNLQHTWILECDVLPCFAEMELDGHYLDVPGWKRIMGDNLQKAQDMIQIMNPLVEPYVQKNLFGELEINYGSPDQVLKVLQKMGLTTSEQNKVTRRWEETLISSTNDKTLKKIKDNEFTKALKKFRGYMMRYSTFGQPYIAAVSPYTGRIHPRYHQIGTETGRPAKAGDANDVNFLNIPREREMRECFRGAPDEVVETDDFSGCELRIWAEISQDPRLCEAFLQGMDVHCYAASRLYRVEVTKKNENAHLRTPAKAINFGIAYGMGFISLVDQINGMGFPITRKEGKELYERYTKEFEKGIAFLRDTGKIAREQGFVHNLLGRRRGWRLPDPSDTVRFPKGSNDDLYKWILSQIERQGGNFVIQSVNADITKYAMVLIRRHIKKTGVRSKFMNQVYDEIVTRTHKDDSEAFHPVKKKLMVEAAERWLKIVPMEVDGHVGPTWTK